MSSANVWLSWTGDSLKSFRRRYPFGPNYVVASDVPLGWFRSFDGIGVQFVSLKGLIDVLTLAGS